MLQCSIIQFILAFICISIIKYYLIYIRLISLLYIYFIYFAFINNMDKESIIFYYTEHIARHMYF